MNNSSLPEKKSKIKNQKRKEFERLFASRYDFSQANFCASFLLKKGWHSYPWERRGSIYAQQTAFVTNLVISYARPFNKSKEWPTFPLKIARLSSEQKAIHKVLLQKRNEIFAHSDSHHFKFDPWYTDGFRTTIERIPFAVISKKDTQIIEEMTSMLIRVASIKISELHIELA